MNVKSIDKSNMFRIIYDFPVHIQESFKLFKENHTLDSKEKFKNIESIVILGMGGSAITGLLMKEILKDEINIPISINQNYTLPKWVNKKTLIIASSYSGNTEETLTACKEGISKKCKIIGFSTGGKLVSLLKNKKYKNFVIMPNGLQPRAAIGYAFSMMLLTLNQIGLIKMSMIKNLKNSIKILKKKSEEYSRSNKNNKAYMIALKIYKKNPIIYSEEGVFNIIGYRLKCQLAENSKILSFNNSIPEMNHNEIEAFSNKIKTKNNFIIVWIDDDLCYNRNQRRISVVSKIIKSKINSHIFLKINEKKSKNKILHYLEYINLVDWISYHCSILNKIDPSEIPNIMKLKKTL